MAIHFRLDEFVERQRRAIAELDAAGLDGVLLFKQESMYYLTGYDTFGFCFFQCLFLNRDGRMTLLTRSADLRQAEITSVIDDIRIWVDGTDANPALKLREIVREHVGDGARIGIETDTHGLTASNWQKVQSAMDGCCNLVEASDLVSTFRMYKSASELAYVRRAGELADDALAHAESLAVPGAFEGDIIAAMHCAIFRGGGDYSGNPFIIGSGEGALLCRYFTGRRELHEYDQLTLEFAAAYRHYHAALMRTLVIGEPSRQHIDMHAACGRALDSCIEAAVPGNVYGDVFDAHARELDSAGLREHRLNACGYSLGATFAPTWMDGPLFCAGNQKEIRPGMVLFIHIIVANSRDRLAMSLGETVVVRGDGNERLSRAPRNLVPVAGAC